MDKTKEFDFSAAAKEIAAVVVHLGKAKERFLLARRVSRDAAEEERVAERDLRQYQDEFDRLSKEIVAARPNR